MRSWEVAKFIMAIFLGEEVGVSGVRVGRVMDY